MEPRAVDEAEKNKIEDHFKGNNPEAFTEDNILGAVVMVPPSFFFKKDDPQSHSTLSLMAMWVAC